MSKRSCTEAELNENENKYTTLTNKLKEIEEENKKLKQQYVDLQTDITLNYKRKPIPNPTMDNNLVHKSLELGRSDNTLLYNDDLKEYSGFYNFRDTKTFTFKNVYNNRLVSNIAVENKLKVIKQKYQENKKLINFGNIKLVIILDNTVENNNTFWIIDGQHRIQVFKELNENVDIIPSTIPIMANTSIKLVNNQTEMNEYLQLYQQQYLPELRLFSCSIIERKIKDFLITTFREKYPKAFKKYDNYLQENFSSLIKNYEDDGNISDGLVADLYNKITIFHKIIDNDKPYIISNPHIIDDINSHMINNVFNHTDDKRNKSKSRKIEDNDNCSYGFVYKLNCFNEINAHFH